MNSASQPPVDLQSQNEKQARDVCATIMRELQNATINQERLLEDLAKLTIELRSLEKNPGNNPQSQEMRQQIQDTLSAVENKNIPDEKIQIQLDYLRGLTSPEPGNTPSSSNPTESSDFITIAQAYEQEHQQSFSARRDELSRLAGSETNPQRKEWLENQVKKIDQAIESGTLPQRGEYTGTIDLMQRPPYFEPDAGTPYQLQISPSNCNQLCKQFANYEVGIRAFDQGNRVDFHAGGMTPDFSINTNTLTVTVNNTLPDTLDMVARFIQNSYPQQPVEINTPNSNISAFQEAFKRVGIDPNTVRFKEPQKPETSPPAPAPEKPSETIDQNNAPPRPSPSSPRP